MQHFLCLQTLERLLFD